MTFGDSTPAVIPVQIQYRAPGTARSWVTVASIENAAFDGIGYGFSATVDQPASGRWRAWFPGVCSFGVMAVNWRTVLRSTLAALGGATAAGSTDQHQQAADWLLSASRFTLQGFR